MTTVPNQYDIGDIAARLEAASRLLRRALAGESNLLDSTQVALEYLDQAGAIMKGR